MNDDRLKDETKLKVGLPIQQGRPCSLSASSYVRTYVSSFSRLCVIKLNNEKGAIG